MKKKGKSAIDSLPIKALCSGDELAVIDLGVEDAFCKQFLMGPPLDDIAVIDEEDDVGVADGGKAYHNLWRIKHSFRVMETCLEARPAYVSDPNAIFGHFLIVYYALTVMRPLELKVFEGELPIEQLFDFVRGYNVTETREGGFVNNATDTPTYRAIKEKRD